MVGNPTPASVEALLGLMGRFGDSTGLAATGVTVTDRVEPGRLKDQDILVIGGSTLAGSKTLFADSPVVFDGGGLQVTEKSPLQTIGGFFANRQQADMDDVAATVRNSRGFSGIVSFRSPFGSDRTVVALLADDASALPQLVDGMADNKINAQIQGDLSVVSGEGMVSYAVGPTYWVGNVPAWMKVAYWFSKRPFLMALSTLILALVLTGPVYLFFRRQARARLGAAGGAGEKGE
jgi:cellulose synthase (UDP-forming)